MRKALLAAFSSWLLVLAHPATADGLVIVANTQEKDVTLNKQQLRNLFMGGAIQGSYIPVSMTPDRRSRVIFNTRVIGLTESRIQSYWAQLKFAGRGKPPIEFSTIEDLLAYVEKTPGAVTYLPGDVTLPESLQVVFSVPE